MTATLERIGAVPAWVWLGISIASLLLSVAGVLAIPWLVGRMPTDWFARPPQTFRARLRAEPARTAVRNGLGVLLVFLGVALLFLPGQGVLTIVLGVVLTDLPIRDRGLRWVAARPALARQLQRWRTRFRAPPFAGLP